jgi:hypothetical protein
MTKGAKQFAPFVFGQRLLLVNGNSMGNSAAG